MTGKGGTGHDGGRLGCAPKLIDRRCSGGLDGSVTLCDTVRPNAGTMRAPTDRDLDALGTSLLAIPAPYLPGDRIANEGRTSGFGLPGHKKTSPSSTMRMV
jgi:hypothetical protein